MIDDMKKYFFYACLLLVWVLPSCQNDDSDVISEDVPLYQNLAVEYNVSQNTMHVAANFNRNDSTGRNVRLGGNSSILFNEKTPNFANVGIYFYTLSISGLDDVTFKFTRAKGEVYTNKASIKNVSPIAIPESFTSASIKGSTTLTWEGAPLGENEYAAVSINYKGGVNNVYNYEKGSMSMNITFPNVVSAGKATLSLSRVKRLPLQESNGTAGGKIDVSYVQSKEIMLE